MADRHLCARQLVQMAQADADALLWREEICHFCARSQLWLFNVHAQIEWRPAEGGELRVSLVFCSSTCRHNWLNVAAPQAPRQVLVPPCFIFDQNIYERPEDQTPHYVFGPPQ